MSQAINTLKYLLEQGFSVVMEGIFQDPKYITLSTNIARQKNIPLKVYELECSLKTLQTRDQNRPGVKEGCRKPLGDTVIARLHNIVKENPWDEAEKLDTEKLSLDECVDVLSNEFKN